MTKRWGWAYKKSGTGRIRILVVTAADERGATSEAPVAIDSWVRYGWLGEVADDVKSTIMRK